MNLDLSFNHLFAVVASLEKCLSHSEKMLLEQEFQPQHVFEQIQQQRDCLDKMQTVANTINEFAVEGDWGNVVRSFHIFYGINTMVRPEIVSMFSRLARKEICLDFSRDSASLH